MSDGGLDFLLKASKQVEALVERERAALAGLQNAQAVANKLKSELNALQTRHAQETAQSQQQLKNHAVRDAQLRGQLTACQTQLQTVTGHAHKLQEFATRQKADLTEQRQRFEFELNTHKAALGQSRQQVAQLEQALAELRPQIARSKAELERAQGEALHQDHRHQSALLTYRTQESQLQDTIAGLRELLRRTQSDLATSKNHQGETEHFKRLAEQNQRRMESFEAKSRELDSKTQQLMEENRRLNERISTERQRREQIEAASRSADSEKDMLRSCMRTAEERLADAEAKLSRMSSEMAMLRAANMIPRAPIPIKPVPSFDPLSAIEELAVMGYPVIHANS